MCEPKKIPKPEELIRQASIAKDDTNKRGPVTWKSFAVISVVLGSVIGTYVYAKKAKQSEMDKVRKREIGKSKIGGPFNLIDQDGKPKSSSDFLGKWVLLYFGVGERGFFFGGGEHRFSHTLRCAGERRVFLYVFFFCDAEQ